jgi:DNA helicase-2/ATP-dependent DNA helicase PcrA
MIKNKHIKVNQVGDKNIETILKEAHTSGICIMDDRLEEFKLKNKYLYDRVMEVPFKEFQKVYNYLEGKTPFTTQHKTKGAEFDNVFVILDNGRWNNYNFENLFLEKGSPSVLDRTQKLFYVCCTRAKKRLGIFYYKPSEDVLTVAKNWFGKENVISV